MLSRFPIHHIPNGIDTDIYQPIDNAQCRQVLNIPEGKHVLMFGAASLNDTRKGGDLLHKALIDLPQSLIKGYWDSRLDLSREGCRSVIPQC